MKITKMAMAFAVACLMAGSSAFAQDDITLFPELPGGISITGWTDIGYQPKADGTFTGNGRSLNQKEWGKLNLNQQYFVIERVADGSEGFDIGGRFDAIYGVDGNEAQSFGNINPGHYDYLNGFDHGIYEWALPQAYGEIAIGDLSVKLGHFYTIIGYEVVPAPGNFFYSKHLTFYNSQPFFHTGALASYAATDDVTIMGGWVLGMDTGFYQYAGGSAFLGGITWAANDFISFAYSNMSGNLGWRGHGSLNCFITTVNLTDRLQWVNSIDTLNSDLRLDATGQVSNEGAPANFIADGVARNSVAINNYLFYTLTDAWRAGVRQEWWKADGVSYYTMTYGLNWSPFTNLTVRPEIRHMWSPGDDDDLYNRCVFGIDAFVTY